MDKFSVQEYEIFFYVLQFSPVQSLSHVWLFVTPWITALQASLSITSSWSSLRLTSIESVMPSSRLILCHPLLLLTPIPPSIRVFSNESTLCMRWPKYWSFSFSIIPSSEIPGLVSVAVSNTRALEPGLGRPCVIKEWCSSLVHTGMSPPLLGWNPGRCTISASPARPVTSRFSKREDDHLFSGPSEQ